MLSEQERREIEDELGHYPERQAVVPEALKIVQRARGWVSDEGVADIAALLGMTCEEIDSIATFYNLIYRRPVGRYVILICDSVSCWIMGYPTLRDHLTTRLGIALGQTTADGRFTLLPTECLGACDQAPAMMIGEEFFGNLTPESVDEILARYK